MTVLTLQCATLVVAADLLFYRQPLGWTPALFAALLVLAIVARRRRMALEWPGRFILLALLGLELCLIEHPGPLRISLTSVAIGALACASANGWTSSVVAWVGRGSELAARCVFQCPLDMVQRSRWLRRRGRNDIGTRLIVNWCLPLLLSAVFIGLFALANPVISNWLGVLGDTLKRVFIQFGDNLSIGRMALWIMFGFGCWALLRGRGRGLVTARRAESLVFVPRQQAKAASFAPLVVRCLILFNLVFAIQMGLDLVTMLSHGATLPSGMNYSQYAHRGAYPLIATALLAAAFVLIAFPTGRGEETEREFRWARRLVYLWIGQNILLTGSAVWRLWMYIEAFGLTRLRVAAAIWMLLVAIGLAWIIWRIVAHRTNSWLLRVNTVTLLAVLYGCCFINFESMIAWYDVTRCKDVGGTGPNADYDYLRSLGPESIPPLEWLAQQLPHQPSGDAANAVAAQLRDDLQIKLQTWQGWTLRRSRLAAEQP